MRIGQVNQDNYKDYLKILGIKNPKSLDILEKGKRSEKGAGSISGANIANGEPMHNGRTRKETEAELIRLGYVEMEGMIIWEDDDGSWKKIVDVPDYLKQDIIDEARRIFKTNGDGMLHDCDADKTLSSVKDYILSLPPSERLSASWTLEQVFQAENQRMVDYVKASDPSWTFGQKINSDILKNIASGNYLNTKA